MGLNAAIRLTITCSNMHEKLEAVEMFAKHFDVNLYEWEGLDFTIWRATTIRHISDTSFYIEGIEVWGHNQEDFIIFLHFFDFPFTKIKIDYACPYYEDANIGYVTYVPDFENPNMFHIDDDTIDFWPQFNDYIDRKYILPFLQTKKLINELVVASITQSIVLSLESSQTSIILANDEKHIPHLISSYLFDEILEPTLDNIDYEIRDMYFETMDRDFKVYEVEFLRYIGLSEYIINLWFVRT